MSGSFSENPELPAPQFQHQLHALLIARLKEQRENTRLRLAELDNAIAALAKLGVEEAVVSVFRLLAADAAPEVAAALDAVVRLGALWATPETSQGVKQ